MSENVSATGQDHESAAKLVARVCRITMKQARAALDEMDSHKPGWVLQVSGPGGRADLTCYGPDNYTVRSR